MNGKSKNKMKQFLFLSLIILFLSCAHYLKDSEISVDLGNRYRFINEYPYAIIYNINDEDKDSGQIIVPPNVVNYSYDNKYIIAKRIDDIDKNKPIEYWIVDKEKKGENAFPLDWDGFYNKINELGIKLEFKPENEISIE